MSFVKAMKGVTVAVVLGIGMMMAGCGNTGQAADKNTGASPAASTAPAAGGKTELLFWAPFSGPDGPFMKKIVDAYNQQSDKYQVKFQIQPRSLSDESK